MANTLPAFQDEVVHVTGRATGTVIATYVDEGVSYLDVRGDERIYYKTPAANWTVIRTQEEIEGTTDV